MGDCDTDLRLFYFNLVEGTCPMNSSHEAFSETSRRDLSLKFKPVWIRGTAGHGDQILVPATRFCGKNAACRLALALNAKLNLSYIAKDTLITRTSLKILISNSKQLFMIPTWFIQINGDFMSVTIKLKHNQKPSLSNAKDQNRNNHNITRIHIEIHEREEI